MKKRRDRLRHEWKNNKVRECARARVCVRVYE